MINMQFGNEDACIHAIVPISFAIRSETQLKCRAHRDNSKLRHLDPLALIIDC